MFITGEIETHYNGLAEEYVTGPHFVTQIPIFAIFVMGEEGTISQAVLISNGYWSDFQSLLSSVIGQ